MLPQVADSSTGSVVILRLRGRTDFGTTFIDVLRRYALALDEVGSSLKLVSVSERILEQLAMSGLAELLGPDNVYPGDDRVGHVFARANADAMAWVESRR